MPISEADWDLLTGRAHRLSLDEMPVPKVYVFYQLREANRHWFVALAEDGTCLKSGWSDSETLVVSEARSNEWLDAYMRHYPEGYELVWGGPIDPDAIAWQEPASGGSMSFIEGQRYCEVLAALAGESDVRSQGAAG
jgi:hypothetical protein